jgi:cobaltochelatase CobN
VAREIVRDDQWQEFVEVYVKDKYNLGLAQWFERHNPHALAQLIERMLEAARQEYWQADPQVVAELKERYRDLARRYDVKSDNAAFEEFVASSGYGLSALSPAPASAPPDPTPAPMPPAPSPIETVQGLHLERIEPSPTTPPQPLSLLMVVLALVSLAGAWYQSRPFSIHTTRRTA